MTNSRNFSDAPAVRSHVPLFVGLMGPSSSGKTYSALRLAKGIQSVSGGDIFGIDTESKRMLHYADEFKFRHVEFKAPFGSLDYLEAARYCTARGAGVVIIDSMSHEHIGPGGYLQTQEAEMERMSGGDMNKAERVRMAAWIKPSRLRSQMITGLLQLNCNFIFCFRAKEKIKPIPGKQPLELGFMPIAGDELLFEMTLNCLLLPKAGGVPTWRSDAIGERLMMKCPRQFEDLLAKEQPLNEEIGAGLAEWARGGADKATVRPAAPPTQSGMMELIASGDEAAGEGLTSLRVFWENLTPAEKAAVGGRKQLAAWKATAEASEVKWDDEETAEEGADAAA